MHTRPRLKVPCLSSVMNIFELAESYRMFEDNELIIREDVRIIITLFSRIHQACKWSFITWSGESVQCNILSGRVKPFIDLFLIYKKVIWVLKWSETHLLRTDNYILFEVIIILLLIVVGDSRCTYTQPYLMRLFQCLAAMQQCSSSSGWTLSLSFFPDSNYIWNLP